MKIVIVGATGTMGKYLASAFEKEHEIIKVGSKGGDIRADITSPASIENLFKQTGSFDALICTEGPSYVGPWKMMTDKEFRKGIDGKLMGQVNLVLIGQHYINPKGSFTLIAGALTNEPVLKFANASAANGAVEAFVAPLVEPGRITSLAQALLKLTSPGVPDIYQGCELWDHSLVDPDNRRPVDFTVRRPCDDTGIPAYIDERVLSKEYEDTPDVPHTLMVEARKP